MMAVKHLSDTNISKVCSTLVGGVIATSIIVFGNGAVSVGNTQDCTRPIICSNDEKTNVYASCAVTGFFSAFLNTLFFMTLLVGLFGNTEYVKGLMGGRNIIIGCCMMVGVNAVCEMFSSTLITGAVGAALSKARLLPVEQKGKRK